MEQKKLFPTFDVPEMKSVQEKPEEKYRRSLMWDFKKGDFVKSGANRLLESDGRETYIQWCLKMAATERYMCLAYPEEIGTEIEEAMKQPDQKAVESMLERTITEALLVNPRTDYVRDFSFSWSGDSVWCSFTVKGKDWEAIELNTSIGLKEVNTR